MTFSNFSDVELLGCIVGVREAKRLYKGALTPLFVSSPGVDDPVQKLVVARELVKRMLCEELKKGPVLENPSVVRDYLRAYFAGQGHESFIALFTDSQHQLIAVEELARGTINGAAVYAREVVKAALKHNAAAVIFAHNHPSGIAEPSAADRVLTERLKQALRTVDVSVLDHCVVGATNVVCFAERGWL